MITQKRNNEIKLLLLVTALIYSCNQGETKKICSEYDLVKNECIDTGDKNLFEAKYEKNLLKYIVCKDSYYDTIFYNDAIYYYKEKNSNGISSAMHYILCKNDTIYNLRLANEFNPSKEQYLELRIYFGDKFTSITGVISDTAKISARFADLKLINSIKEIDTIFSNELTQKDYSLLNNQLQ